MCRGHMEKIIQILKKTSSLLSLGLAGIFGVLIISIISVGFQNTEIEQNFGAFPGIFGMFFLYWMFIWIHEAGHAVAVKLCGHNLHVLRNGRFGFTFAPFKFKYFGPIVESDYGGCVVHSPKRNEWSQVKDIIIAAAGSLGTLIVGLIAFALSFLFIDYSTLVSLLGATDPKYDQIHHAVSPIGCLLFSCFLIGIVDPLCNWIPRQLSLGGNDGATILSRLKKPYWNDITWAENMVLNALYNEVSISDDDLELARQIYEKSPWSQTGDFKQALADIAWRRTEPHNFVKIINHNNTDFSQHPAQLYHQYIASLVLCNQADESLLEDFQNVETDKENITFIYWFASSLVNYKQNHHKAALAAIDKFRESVMHITGGVPPEEAAIFDRIISRKPLPVYA